MSFDNKVDPNTAPAGSTMAEVPLRTSSEKNDVSAVANEALQQSPNPSDQPTRSRLIAEAAMEMGVPVSADAGKTTFETLYESYRPPTYAELQNSMKDPKTFACKAFGIPMKGNLTTVEYIQADPTDFMVRALGIKKTIAAVKFYWGGTAQPNVDKQLDEMEKAED